MKSRIKYFIPLIIGVLALFLPLVSDFHIESAIIAATVGAFWAGISATWVDKERGDVHRALHILWILYLVGLPLLINALITGCYTVDGLGFWLFLPAPSVFFGYGIGRLARIFKIPFPKLITVLVLLGVAFGSLTYEFFSFPQLYFFNHVWGYWPGPIYDEAVTFTWPVISFRFITFCWILILWLVPSLHKDIVYRWIVGLSVVALLISYTQLEQMGIITSSRYLQRQLGGFKETSNARLYFDANSFSEDEIDQEGKEIEFYITQIKKALHVEKPDSSSKIEVYLYADPWQKKQLVGAKYTSYVTVWQHVPQIHIAKEDIPGSLKHEVVHAVTALLPWQGLFPNIGLTEGIAVALDPDRSPSSTIDQLVAADPPYPSAKEMRSALSYWGFYTSRSAVSYTTTGSFVRYLIKSRPPEDFVKAYQCGSLEQGYSEPVGALVTGWHKMLASVPVDTSDQRRAGEIFGRPSIFEQRCPHKVPPAAQLFDHFLLSEARHDTAAAIASLSELKEIDSTEYSPTSLWMFWNLKAGKTKAVIEAADLDKKQITRQLFTADAFELEGQYSQAQKYLYRAVTLAAQQSDTTFDNAFAARYDTLQWKFDMQLRYNNYLLTPDQFDHFYYRLKMQSLQNVLEQKKRHPELLKEYADQLYNLPTVMDHFNTYLAMIHRLAYDQNFEEAEEWIQKLSGESLLLRYKERLQQEQEWLQYLQSQ